MSIQLYKPNSRMTGSAISLQASDQNEFLYISLIRQASWNDQTKKGSFSANRNKPGFHVTLKFNQTEAGNILDALERFYEYSTFHNSAEATTSIRIGPGKPKNEGEAPNCYIFNVYQTNKQDTTKKSAFLVPITFGEARLIREYLVHYLHKSFKMSQKGNEKPAPTEHSEPFQPEQTPTQQEAPPMEPPLVPEPVLPASEPATTEPAPPDNDDNW